MKDFNPEMYSATIEASLFESVFRTEDMTYWVVRGAYEATRWVTVHAIEEAMK